MLQKPTPILVAERFPALLDALLDVLTSLSSVDWDRPTTVAGWRVKDVALHLLGDEIGFVSGKRDGFQKGSAPVNTWPELVALINRRNAHWVEATQRISPRMLSDLLRWSGDQFNAYVRTLDVYALGGAVSWAGFQPAPVWLDLAREYTERWHHQQHIREAVDWPGGMEADKLGPVLATFVYALPQTYRQASAAPGSCVTLTISGPAGGAWSVMHEAQGWQLYTGRPAAPLAEVILPQDTAWRLFTKGISKTEARHHANLLGDSQLAEQMLETVSIIA